MSRMVSAQIRDELEDRYETVEGEEDPPTNSDFLRGVIDEGLRAKETDVLDRLGASDELRAAVEREREEGEPLDVAVLRLLREGAEAEAPTSPGDRAVLTALVAVLSSVPLVLWLTAGPALTVAYIILLAVSIAFGERIDRALAALRQRTRGLGE